VLNFCFSVIQNNGLHYDISTHAYALILLTPILSLDPNSPPSIFMTFFLFVFMYLDSVHEKTWNICLSMAYFA
jgi:hypothetical protein